MQSHREHGRSERVKSWEFRVDHKSTPETFSLSARTATVIGGERISNIFLHYYLHTMTLIRPACGQKLFLLSLIQKCVLIISLIKTVRFMNWIVGDRLTFAARSILRNKLRRIPLKVSNAQHIRQRESYSGLVE